MHCQSTFSPNATDPTPQELDDLIVQLPPPLLFMGDVNAVHPACGGVRSDVRGNTIETAINKHNLTVLNTGQGTRLNLRGQDRAIDLTCCTNTIHHLFEWGISSDPGPSDHFRIKISLSPGSNPPRKNLFARLEIEKGRLVKIRGSGGPRPG